jgi:hypothetical protein
MRSPDLNREKSLLHLVEAVEDYLASNGGPGTQELCAALPIASSRAVRPTPVSAEPMCGFLDEALSCIEGADELRAAIESARSFLCWVTYDLYPRAEIGPYFPAAHAFASLVGPGAPVAAEDVDLGLFLIAPKTLYRDRHHAAPELYAPLTGPHRWRFGADTSWIEQPAHRTVWNEPWAVHATLTGEKPFLCIYGWTRDINVPARVVHAADWNMIEAAL